MILGGFPMINVCTAFICHWQRRYKRPIPPSDGMFYIV